MKKRGILVVNLGTPEKPNYQSVKKYLSEFLMDGRVIDLQFWKRWILVKGIIAPFRSRKVAREYKKLWTDEGAPLLVHGQSLVNQLKKLYQYNEMEVEVELAMRYQTPSIENALNKLRKNGVGEIVVFPLFPQYASATTGSVNEEVMRVISKWQVIPTISFTNSYHDHNEYIRVFAGKVSEDVRHFKPDHVLFSYHGIPQRHLDRIKLEGGKICSSEHCNCELKMFHQPYCYRSACFHTSMLIAERVDLEYKDFSTSFQSRLGKDPWIQPYTDQTIKELRKNGVKKLLVVSPSFVADCLETTIEIGEEYKELFMNLGGEGFEYTKSLNASVDWTKAIFNMINDKYFKDSPSQIDITLTNWDSLEV